MDRRTFLKLSSGISPVVGGLGVSVKSNGASADSAYPGSLTVSIVVPFPPGGTAGILGRVLSDGLNARWKTTTIVEHVAGAATNVAMEKTAHGSTDGSQLLIVPGNFAVNQFLYRKLPFNPDTDLIPVSLITRIPLLLCVRKDLPIKTAADLIAYAKTNPGKLNFASPGVGSSNHLSGEIFKKASGIDMVHVPYKGSAPAVNDLIAGHVDLMFEPLPSIGPQAAAGNVVGIAVTSAQKSHLAPDYPPVAETLPGFDVRAWFGVAVRTGTPQMIVDEIEASVIAICRQEDIKARLVTGLVEADGWSAQQFAAFLFAERKRMGQLIRDLNISAD